MPHPKHRRTRSDKRRRASHFALKKANLGVCAKCKSPVRPHHACAECGSYAGREAIDTSRTVARAVKKTQAAASEAPAKADAKNTKESSKEEKESKSAKE